MLMGNISPNGCIVKTAGVDESILTFKGRARIFESQDDAVKGILNDQVKAGDIVIIRYEGPKGGPWHAKCSTRPVTLNPKDWAKPVPC